MLSLSQARDVAHDVLGSNMVQELHARRLVVVDAEYHDRMKVALQEIQEIHDEWVAGINPEAMEAIGEVLMNAEVVLKGE